MIIIYIEDAKHYQDLGNNRFKALEYIDKVI